MAARRRKPPPKEKGSPSASKPNGPSELASSSTASEEDIDLEADPDVQIPTEGPVANIPETPEKVEFADSTFDDQRKKKAVPSAPVGHGGVAIFGGYIDDKDTNPELRGTRRYKTYAELFANVSIVAASVRYVLNLIGKAKWKVDPARDSGDAGRRVADIVEECMHDMVTPWHRVVRRASTYRFHGFSVQEWTAKKRKKDGWIGFADVESRAQYTIERWDADLTGTVYGVEQRSPQTQEPIYIPRTKLVYVVDDTFSDSPEGLGLFRHIAPTAIRLQEYEKLEGWGFVTDLRGTPIGRAPYALLDNAVKATTITAAQKAAILAPLESFMRSHLRDPSKGALALILDSMTYASKDEAASPSAVYQFGIDLMKAETTSQEAMAAAIQRLTREIARIVGTEGLLLGESGAGSLAMARDKSDVLAMLVDGALIEIAFTLDRDLVRPLGILNGWPEELWPKCQPEKVQWRDVTTVTEALEGLAKAGAPVLPDDPAINTVRTALGLSEIDLAKVAQETEMMRRAELEAMRAKAQGGKPPGAEDEEPFPGTEPQEDED